MARLSTSGVSDYYHRRIVVEDEPYRLDTTHERPDDEVYYDRMHRVLSAYPTVGIPREPTNLIGGVFLGSQANAENIPLLKSLRISFIINCAGGRPFTYRRSRKMYESDTGILGYEELGGEDDDDCNILSILDRGHGLLDHARSRGGRVLLYSSGLNLSGAVAITYLITNGFRLLEATKLVKDSRRVALVRTSFMKQVVEFASRRGMLDLDCRIVTAPVYGRPLDRYRINSSHLPQFL